MTAIEQAIQVDPNGDFVEFLGRAKETIESDTHYYYLIVGNSAGRRMQTRVARPIGSTVVSNNYLQTSYVKQRLYYIERYIEWRCRELLGDYRFAQAVEHLISLCPELILAGTRVTSRLSCRDFRQRPHSVGISRSTDRLSDRCRRRYDIR